MIDNARHAIRLHKARQWRLKRAEGQIKHGFEEHCRHTKNCKRKSLLPCPYYSNDTAKVIYP